MLFRFFSRILDFQLFVRFGYTEKGITKYSYKILGVWFNTHNSSDQYPSHGMIFTLGGLRYHDEFGTNSIEFMSKLFGYVEEKEFEVVSERTIETQGKTYQLSFGYITEFFSNLRFLNDKHKAISIYREGQEPYVMRYFEGDDDFLGVVDRYERVLEITSGFKDSLEEFRRIRS